MKRKNYLGLKEKMKKIVSFAGLLFMILIIFSFKNSDPITGEKILLKMHNRFAGKWYKTFTFTQKTESYINDSLIKTATWHEAIVFPDYFRISFGKMKEGNAVIFVKDSSFNFSKGKLVRKELRGEDLTFLLGGMYFYPLDTVFTKMHKEGYDINKAHESTWKGKKYFVLGSQNDEEKTNQLWIDKEKLFVKRFIKYNSSGKEEGLFGDHVKIGKAWSETSCSFFVNDKLIQKESYYDCIANKSVNLGLFDPYNFHK